MEKKICPHRSQVGSQNQDIVEIFCFVSVRDAPFCRSHGKLGTDPPDSRTESQPGPICGSQEAGGGGGLSFCAPGLFVASACNPLFSVLSLSFFFLTFCHEVEQI